MAAQGSFLISMPADQFLLYRLISMGFQPTIYVTQPPMMQQASVQPPLLGVGTQAQQVVAEQPVPIQPAVTPVCLAPVTKPPAPVPAGSFLRKLKSKPCNRSRRSPPPSTKVPLPRMPRPKEAEIQFDEAERLLSAFVTKLVALLDSLVSCPRKVRRSEVPEDKFLHNIPLPTFYSLPTFIAFHGKQFPECLSVTGMLYRNTETDELILDLKRLRLRVTLRVEKGNQRVRADELARQREGEQEDEV
jgi:hypothetical protein